MMDGLLLIAWPAWKDDDGVVLTLRIRKHFTDPGGANAQNRPS